MTHRYARCLDLGPMPRYLIVYIQNKNLSHREFLVLSISDPRFYCRLFITQYTVCRALVNMVRDSHT